MAAWTIARATRRSIGDAVEIVRESLLEATRIRLRADVPLGAFLSGGVDSSAVVAAMAMQGSGQTKTFSIGFDVDGYDETPFARAVAERYGCDHHEFLVQADAIEILPRMVWHYGEPFADSSALPSFYLSELTRAHVTVALNGDGGDESFAGYERYRAEIVAERLGVLPASLQRAVARGAERLGGGARASDVARPGHACSDHARRDAADALRPVDVVFRPRRARPALRPGVCALGCRPARARSAS